MKEVRHMAENNIKYLNDSNNKEFIEIYEDEIKRLVQKNEVLRVSVEEKENTLNVLQHEKAIMQKDLEKVNSLALSMEKLTKQNALYKEKLESLTNEKVKLNFLVDELRQNSLKCEEPRELSTKLEIEKQKVASLQERLKIKDAQLNSLMNDKEANISLIENQAEFVELKEDNEKMKQQLAEEKLQLVEMLLEARMQAKYLVDVAIKEADKIKDLANKEMEDTREKAKVMSSNLEKIKNESNTFVSNLIEEVDGILN